MVRIFTFITSLCLFTLSAFANDDCSNAITLTPNTTCVNTSANFNAMTIVAPNPSCAASASQDMWFKFIATDSTMSIHLGSVSSLNHGFSILNGSCAGNVITCVNNSGAGFGESYFNNNFIPGTEYFIRVFNASSSLSTASFNICVRKYSVPDNDVCADAIQLMPNTTCQNITATFSGAMMNGGTAACATSASQDLWFYFVATDSTMSVHLGSTSDLNHGFQILTGSCTGSVYACVNNSSAGFGESYFNNNFIPGQTYYVRVLNASGTLSTSSFNICVRKYPVPSNDVCATAQELTPGATCTTNTATFSGAMMNGGSAACATSASQDLWFYFVATDSTMSVHLGSTSDLNHGFQILTGSCTGAVHACVNNSSAGFGESYFNNNFVPGQTYYVRALNASATLSTASFNICVRRYPVPSNDVCATAQELTPGTTCTTNTATFSGAMMNGGSAACASSASQDLWFYFVATDTTMSVHLGSSTDLNHGFQILTGGCTGAVHACVNNSSAGFGESYFNNNFIPGQTYYVRALNASGTLTTASFNICVRKYPVPSNDACSNALELIPNLSCNTTTATFSGAMMNSGGTLCAPNSSQDVWYYFVATDSTMSVHLGSSTDLNHGFQILIGSCTGAIHACVNNSSAGFGESYFNNNFIPGQTYYVRALNASGTLSTASFTICVRRYPAPSNDSCTNAIQLTPNTTCQSISATFSGAMMNGNTPACGLSSSQDIYYRFTATSNGMTVQLGSSSDLNHGFQIFEGGCNGTLVSCTNSSSSGFGESTIYNTLVPGTEYIIRVFNASSSLSTNSFNICVIGPAGSCTPAVTISAPQLSICTGQSLTFTANPINGGSTPSYQWKINGQNVGSNNSSLTSTTLVNGDVVSCVMTSNASCISGSATATSNNITVTVNPNVTPSFNQVAAICSGQSFTLPTTSLNGISGSWSPNLNFTTSTTYTFTPFSGQCGTTTTMLVTVNQSILPQFTQVAAVCPGTAFTLPATSNNGISGTWSPAINTNITTNYTFTPNSGQCAESTSMTVEVSNGVTPVFTQVESICTGENFTLPSTSNNGITGTWTPAINNTQTTTYTFTPNTGQCAESTTMLVEVGNGTAPEFTQIESICTGESFTLPSTSNNGITGTWTPAINNTQTTTYTFTPNAGQCAAPVTMTVEISAGVVPTFNAIFPICMGDDLTLPVVSLNNIEGTWSPAFNSQQTTTYTFTPLANQCAVTTSLTVQVTEINTATAVTANTIVALAGNATYQWIDCATGENIAGANGGSFTPTLSGIYAVKLNVNGCEAQSDCVSITITDIEENFANTLVQAYPNPFTDVVVLKTERMLGKYFSITDLLGKTIARDIVSNDNTPIYTNAFSKGIYILRIEGTEASIKIIKQ